MRITPIVTLIAIFLLPVQQQTPDACSPAITDPYAISFVSSALQYFGRKDGPFFSFEAKQYTHLSPSLPELADGVSIAVLKIWGKDELARPENASTYLTVIRASFSDRKRVSEKSNTEPKVTLLVLDYLQEKEASEAGLEKRIEYMKRCVNDFSCSPQSESDFFKSR
jgi:hypothetical protein